LNVAAIDIGSNAARLYICSFFHDGADQTRIKILEFVRVPVRLGEDVFTTQRIPEAKEAELLELLKAFQILMKLFHVEDYKACATSAMREAKNGKEVAQRIEAAIGIKIEIIPGNKEAELIYKAHQGAIEEGGKLLFIDVGGGSTEISLLQGQKKIASKSFNLGAVRILDKKDKVKDWELMREWLKLVVKPFEADYAIGTGGNINKFFDLMKLKEGRFATQKQLKTTYDYVGSFNLEDRIKKLGLNPDRADVILPAIEIYMNVLKASGTGRITISGLGLKEGIVAELLEKHHHAVIRNFQGNQRFSVH
jgi:exopolyphosphatase/guanosine-5'-triphosphate,3'-diphosphate pyrophosphatase